MGMGLNGTALMHATGPSASANGNVDGGVVGYQPQYLSHVSQQPQQGDGSNGHQHLHHDTPQTEESSNTRTG
jgi:hypothetical protein